MLPCSNDDIAALLVKRLGLELIGVQLGRDTARVSRDGLGPAEQRCAMALASQALIHPELVDGQPPPSQKANQAAEDPALRIAQVYGKTLNLRGARLRIVERHETAADQRDIVGIR
ncbi:hypothetical protein BH11GEM1_BH11GEM1_31650 [soil metagenome]